LHHFFTHLLLPQPQHLGPSRQGEAAQGRPRRSHLEALHAAHNGMMSAHQQQLTRAMHTARGAMLDARHRLHTPAAAAAAAPWTTTARRGRSGPPSLPLNSGTLKRPNHTAHSARLERARRCSQQQLHHHLGLPQRGDTAQGCPRCLLPMLPQLQMQLRPPRKPASSHAHTSGAALNARAAPPPATPVDFERANHVTIDHQRKADTPMHPSTWMRGYFQSQAHAAAHHAGWTATRRRNASITHA